MNLGLTVNCWSDEDLLFANQFGVTHILAEASIPPDRQWDKHTLAAMRNRVERAGFIFSGVASLPPQFSISSYLQAAQRNDPAAVESLTALCAFLTEAGVARIPLIGCDCDVPGSGESVIAPEGRGGALIHKYEQPRSIDSDSLATLWGHFTSWMQGVVPVAEKADVKLAFGSKYVTSGWLDSIETLQQLLDVAPSPCVGLIVRHAVLAQTLGNEMATTIRHFIALNKVLLVDFSNLQSKPSSLVDAFLDEPTNEMAQGSAEMLRVLKSYHATGYQGTVIPAPAPGIVGDTDWGHKGQAFNLGYLRSLLQVIEHA